MLFRKAMPVSSGSNDFALERLKNALESKGTIVIGAGASILIAMRTHRFPSITNCMNW